MRYLATLLSLICWSVMGQSLFFGHSPPPVTSTNVTGGLTNWWKFDENTGTTTADSIDGANGTLSGSSTLPVWVTGFQNSCLEYDGIGEFVQLATNVIIGPLSWSTRYNMTNGQPGTLFYDSDNDSTHGWFVWVTNGATGSISFEVACTIRDIKVTVQAAILTNVFQQVGVAWDGTITSANVSIITNGVKDTAVLIAQDGIGSPGINTTATRFIGKGSIGAPFFWAGKIDDMGIYNRVINATEWTQVFTGQVP